MSKPKNLPPVWSKALKSPSTVKPADTSKALLMASGAVLDDVTPAHAKAMLASLSADCDYQQWILIGQALKTQFSEAGLALWQEWSATGTKYPGERETRTMWKSLARHTAGDRSIVTMRSVIKLATDAGYSAKPHNAASRAVKDADRTITESIIARLDCCTTVAEMKTIEDEVSGLELFKSSLEIITSQYITTYFALKKRKLTRGYVHGLLRSNGTHLTRHVQSQGWYKPYLYVEAEQGYLYNTATSLTLATRVFNDKFATEVLTPVDRAQGITRPSIMPVNVLLDGKMIPSVANMLYVPGKPITFDYNGAQYGNAYRPFIPADGDAPDSEAGRDAVAFIRSHLQWMLGEDAARLMEQFLGYTVQRPGERIRWCYLILGPKGVGKSFISSLMRAVLGGLNVRDVHQATLQHTQFNAWAVGSQLTVIEEIRVDGAKKWEIMNSLKAIITNDTIDVHAKGKDAYNAPATSNFLAYSNDPNAISPDADDRRYYITSTTLSTAAEVIVDLHGNTNRDTYFDRLYSLVVTQPKALLHWLQHVSLDGFSPSAAPASQDKVEMAAVARSDDEVEMEAILATGCEGVCAALVDMTAITAHMSINHPGIKGQRIGRTLRTLGYRALCAGPIDPLKTGTKRRWMYSPAHLRAWCTANNATLDVKRPLELVRTILGTRK